MLALGDDRTDDAMFAALPEGAYPVRVGVRPQRARFGLADHNAARELLRVGTTRRTAVLVAFAIALRSFHDANCIE